MQGSTLDLSEALTRILAAAARVSGQERVPLLEAQSRIPVRAITAPIDLPPFASSAMDGYALPEAPAPSGATFTIVGESLAGHPYTGSMRGTECIRITTGAAVPQSAVTVVIQENCERDGARLTLRQTAPPGANIREVGHDVRAGDPVCPGGRPLSSFDIGWLAACGITEIDVHLRPRVAIFSTGDELTPPGETLTSGRIYDANRFATMALLSRLPVRVTDLGILPDDPGTIEQALATAGESHDLILTSGGVSVGDADYVRDIVERLGRIDLWRLNLKPGKPLAFGALGKALFLGLPGNPVSAIVTCLLVAKPLLLKLAGAEPVSPSQHRALLAEPIEHSPGREEFQRGVLRTDQQQTWVHVSGDQSSNRLATFSGADCLIRIPKSAGNLPQGTEVEVLPFYGLTDVF
ncbi:MAG: gephyrin-like molybdotransferase Glp [Pseudomonadales bacterium]